MQSHYQRPIINNFIYTPITCNNKDEEIEFLNR